MRRIGAALLGLTLLVPVSSATASATAQKPPRFQGYLVCSAKKSAPAATTCARNKPKTAVFLSKDADVTYKVCVKFPGKNRPLCATGQVADRGVRSGVSVTAPKAGTLKATWYVGDDKVASGTMDIT